MSVDKQRNEGEGLYQSQWYRAPNSIIDCVAGDILKPGALLVVMTVIRYTEGMGGKKSAAIPTETFKRVLGTNRDKTAYLHVKEAVDSGLVQVIKKQGCVSVYSINQESDLWHKAPVVAEIASSSEKCHIGSGEKRHRLVAESATGVVAESAILIKTTKENYKDNIKDSDNKSNKLTKNTVKKVPATTTVTKPINLTQQIWDDLITLRKAKRAPLTATSWKMAANAIEVIQQNTGHSVEQIVSVWLERGWTTIKEEWYLKHIAADKQLTSYKNMNVNAKYEDPNYDPLDGLSSRTGASNGNY